MLMLAASAILLITIGARQTSGLFLIPITQSTGVSVVAMSFALAIGQFVFGAAQPVFGAIADKYGAEKVIVAGAIMLALGCVLTYEWIWYADIFLALLAAAVNLPIREARLDAQPAAA